MNITFTLEIEHPEDLNLVEQLARRLRLKYYIKEKKAKESILTTTAQLQVFQQMETLRMKLQAVPIPADIDISQLANEVNVANSTAY